MQMIPNRPMLDPLGAALGGGMANQMASMSLNKQWGHLLGGAQQPLNIDALRKISDPRIMQMAMQMLMREQTQQFAAPQAAGEGSPFAPGTVTQRGPGGEVDVLQAPTQRGLTGAEKVKSGIELGTKFRADPRIKDFQIVERSERGMSAALKLSKGTAKSRIASDQALGVLFQKMLDPTSVVRESEFARTPQGASLINRILGGAQKLTKGGLGLTNEDRESLVTMAQRLLDEAKKTYNVAYSEFDTIADSVGLNKKTVFGGAKQFDIGTSTTPTMTTQQKVQELRRRGVPDDQIKAALKLEQR